MGSLERWVRYWSGRGPARPALAVGDELVTWGGLAERTGRLAAGLAERGVGAGDRVEIRTRDPLVLVEMLVACARRGAVAAPLGPAGHPGPGDRTGPPAIVVADLDLVPLDGQVPVVQGGTGRGRLADLLGPPAPDPDPGPGPEMAAELLELGSPPSGSIRLTHGNVEAVAVAGMAANGLVPTDRVAVAADPTSPPALATTLAALHAGALVRFPSGHDDALFDGSASDPPTVLSTTCAELGVGDRATRLVGGPRLVTVPGHVPDGLRAILGAPLRETYGPAVSAGLALQQRPAEPDGGLVPVLGQRARVVDHAGNPVPAERAGELELGGSAVAGAGWVRCGDRAVCARDATLRILCPEPPDAGTVGRP